MLIYVHFLLFSDVTKIGFVGCIENLILQILTVNLKENKQAKNVVPGCPAEVRLGLRLLCQPHL